MCNNEISEHLFLSQLGPTCAIKNTSNLERENIIKLKSIFTPFAQFRQECRSATMSEVRIDVLD